jgi:S-DNA-T family DNA segregation ATPase FtsK/SpoIIIE
MDPLYHEIKKYVQMQERISTSHLQRKFRIGYNRAAKIIYQ